MITRSPRFTRLFLQHAVEEEQVLGALAVADDADRARLVVLRGDGALLVGEERDEGGVVQDLRHLADEAAVGDDGVVDADSARAAGGDDDRLVELADRVGENLGGDGGLRVVLVGGQRA